VVRPAWTIRCDVKKRRILVCADCGQLIGDVIVTLKCQGPTIKSHEWPDSRGDQLD
jgi:hypothetical protein